MYLVMCFDMCYISVFFVSLVHYKMGRGGTAKVEANDGCVKKGGGDDLVWREDEGISLKVPRFYASSQRLMDKVQARTDVPAKLTCADVAKHCSRDDLWIIVDGKAYDVTSFTENHPGGWLPMVRLEEEEEGGGGTGGGLFFLCFLNVGEQKTWRFLELTEQQLATTHQSRSNPAPAGLYCFFLFLFCCFIHIHR
jgi:hypothetical protein